MRTAYLDTHVAVWLHDGLVERLTVEAKRQIEKNDLFLPPMALLELQYLFDRKRIGVEPIQISTYLQATFGVNLCAYPFPAIVLAALSCHWTNDPFDRLITANAIANNNSILITADVTIRRHYPNARW